MGISARTVEGSWEERSARGGRDLEAGALGAFDLHDLRVVDDDLDDTVTDVFHLLGDDGEPGGGGSGLREGCGDNRIGFRFGSRSTAEAGGGGHRSIG